MAAQLGKEAPGFSAHDQQGEEHSLAGEEGNWVILYFYPKDDTPGCTKEACGFRDAFEELSEYATIFGMSGDDTESHARFVEKYRLPFTLLSDEGDRIRAAYGADGSTYPKRTTFLIDPEGVVAKIYDSVDVESHAGSILSDLENLASQEE